MSQSDHLRADELVVEFLGLRTRAVGVLGFGRKDDIVLDPSNMFLHGTAGRFRRDDSRWLLENVGSTLRLRYLHQTGLRMELPPGTGVVLPIGHGRVQLKAGPAVYELEVFAERVGGDEAVTARRTGTLFYGRDLTPAQVDYALTLAAPRLEGSGAPLPSFVEIAELWGVSHGTVRRTFEDIRDRLRSEGVRGLEHPDDLVDYLIVNGILTYGMLVEARIGKPGGPVRRSDLIDGGADAHEPMS